MLGSIRFFHTQEVSDDDADNENSSAAGSLELTNLQEITETQVVMRVYVNLCGGVALSR